MKNWKWTHCVLAAALAVSLVSGGLVLAFPPGGNGGGKPPKDDPPPSVLPEVRYRIDFPDMPANQDPGTGLWLNTLNNKGQVVGWYIAGGKRHAFLYDSGLVADLNQLGAVSVPAAAGLTIRSGIDINSNRSQAGARLLGSEADLATWFGDGAIREIWYITDRAGETDSGQLAGRLHPGGNGTPSILFVLTPEPAPAP